MPIGISSRENIEYNSDLIVELIYSEKGFTFPDLTTVQSFGKNIELLSKKVNEDKSYLDLLLKWVNGGIGNSIMELSGKNIGEILLYINEEYENIIFDIQRLFKDKASEILQNESNNNLSDENISKKISKFRKNIELVLSNPVCMKINSIDNKELRHAGTVYNRTIHMPINIDINQEKSLMELINELKERIGCTGVFILNPEGEMFGNMGDIPVNSIKIGVARQKSQRSNQKQSKISRTALPYYSEGPDTLFLSPGHNKGMVATLIRIPIDIEGNRYDLKIFYKKPVYLNNGEVSISIEYAKVFEKKIIKNGFSLIDIHDKLLINSHMSN